MVTRLVQLLNASFPIVVTDELTVTEVRLVHELNEL
jgi:hypothetical protein